MRPLYIFDITSILFRMYCAGVQHRTPNGVEVGGVIGIVLSLKKHFKRLKPTHIAAVFDSGSKTFRNQIAADYKANRPLPPDDLRPQFGFAVELIEAMGIPVFKKKGYEADDLMASLTKIAREQGRSVHLVSNDKDLHQLISDDAPAVVQHSIDGKKLFQSKEVFDKFGVHPSQMIDYQALVGDSVDHITGVPGIGAKTARILLRNLDSIEGIYDNISDIKKLNIRGASRIEKSLIDHRGTLKKSRDLVRLVEDLKFYTLDGIVCLRSNEHPQENAKRLNVKEDLKWSRPDRAALDLLKAFGRPDLFWALKDSAL